MTKSEVLLLDDPSAIWNEMQKNPALRTDGDVWLHMTRLSAKQDRQWSREAYGDPEAYLYMELKQKEVRCHHGRFSCHLPHFEVFAAKHGL